MVLSKRLLKGQKQSIIVLDFKYIPRDEWIKGRSVESPYALDATSVSPTKTAYVWSGGGMRASFGAGVSEVLEEHNVPKPDFEIAISGNIGNRIYGLSEQVREYSRVIWRDSLCNSKFVQRSRVEKIIFGKRFEVEERKLQLGYLTDLFMESLNTEAVRNSSTELYTPVLNESLGLTQYISNKDRPHLSQAEFREWYVKRVVRAGMTHPLACDAPVVLDDLNINSMLMHYIDGGFGVSLADAVERAAELGAKRLLVVDNENPSSRYDYGYAAYMWWKNRPLGKTVGRRLLRSTAVLPDDVEVIHIYGNGDVPADLLCDDPGKIEATIEAGSKATLKHPGMQQYFTKAA